MTDIRLNHITTQGGDNYYDISFTDGDFTLERGLQTAIQMSVFCEQRIDDEHVPPTQRGGWVGNILQPVKGYEQGSLIWTKYQSNMNPELKSVLEGYLLNAFTWMIEDGIAQDVEAEVNLLANYKIQGIITITKNDGTQIPPQYFDLWEFTSVN
jgi:phage gp46-like protein